MSMRVIIMCFFLQVRVVNGVPPTGDYSFAKYNKVNIGSIVTSVLALGSSLSLSLSLSLSFGYNQHLLFTWFNACLHTVVQSVDITKYTAEEYEKYLTDPVGIMSWLHLFNCIELHLSLL